MSHQTGVGGVLRGRSFIARFSGSATSTILSIASSTQHVCHANMTLDDALLPPLRDKPSDRRIDVICVNLYDAMIRHIHTHRLSFLYTSTWILYNATSLTHAESVLICSVTSHFSAPPLPYPSPSLFWTMRPTLCRSWPSATSSQPRMTQSLSVAMHRP